MRVLIVDDSNEYCRCPRRDPRPKACQNWHEFSTKGHVLSPFGGPLGAESRTPDARENIAFCYIQLQTKEMKRPQR
jgi:hypothetical protein